MSTFACNYPPGLSSDQVSRLRRVADTRPARRALAAGFTFDEQLIVAGALAELPEG